MIKIYFCLYDIFKKRFYYYDNEKNYIKIFIKIKNNNRVYKFHRMK